MGRFRARHMVAMGMMDGGGVSYLLRDDFTDTLAAGAVNGTQATPTGGARVAVDTNSKISIGSGVLNFETGEAANDGVWWGIQTRTAGRAVLAEVTPATTAANHASVGWDTNQTGAANDSIRFLTGAALSIIPSGAAITVGAYTAASHWIAVLMRATGIHYFIKGGNFTNWTLLYSSKVGAANQYPTISTVGIAGVFTATSMRVPQDLLTITPIASDGFGTNETLGNTRGSGSEELGGSGLAYSKTGTWASNGSVASCSALSGGLGMASVNAGTTNVIVEAVCTRTAGNSGLILRYTDASNYITAVLNGTSLVVTEVVSGTPNVLATTAVTYGATKRLIVSCNATKLRCYYGDALVGSELTTAVVSGNNHGIYTDDTGATFDNLVVWAKGNGGEYEGTLNGYANP